MLIPDKTKLTLEEKIGQLLFIGVPTTSVDVATLDLLKKVKPGGICLFARNIKEAGQTRELCDALRSSLEIVPFISLDEEGGLVDRLRRILGPMPAASRLNSPDLAREQATLIAQALRVLGLNMNFAPVVDVIGPERAERVNGLHSRAYGSNAQDVAEYAAAFLSGLRSESILGCLKHFPGLGASAVDSHEELPVVDISPDEIEGVDLYPYRELLSGDAVQAVMVAHAAYPKLKLQETDQDGKLLPSSLSFNVVSKLLRRDLGFDGLVVTDDLEMGAILKNYGVGDAALRAVNAGSDMVAICASPDLIFDAHEHLLRSFEDGRLSVGQLDAAVGRILQLKTVIRETPVPSVDEIPAISQRVADLNMRLS